VAAEANVSVNTVFNYFSTKEELFFDRTEAIGWASDVVRARRRGESALRALRRAFRKALEETELARERLRAFVATIEGSPALGAHVRWLAEQSEERLASTLAAEAGAAEHDPRARAVAALVSASIALILREIRRGILEQRDEAVLRASVSKLGEQSFDLLLAAAGDYCTRPSDDADRPEAGD
jgi:AcrR family transcriptional regulator